MLSVKYKGGQTKLLVSPETTVVTYVAGDGAELRPGTAARFRRESRLFYNAYETGHAYTGTLDPTLVASPGGFPLIEGGKLIGAVGCSGGTGDQDAAICKVGAEVVK